jgi:hypothetical protein
MDGWIDVLFNELSVPQADDGLITKQYSKGLERKPLQAGLT